MATKQTAAKKSAEKKTTSQAPKGFKPIKAYETCDGWWALTEGNVMQGTYLEAFTVKGGKFGPKTIHKIKVTNADGVLITDPNNDGETIEAEEGQVIGVDEKGFLKSLSTIAAGQEVWFKCVKKEPKSKKYPSGCWVFDGPMVYEDDVIT